MEKLELITGIIADFREKVKLVKTGQKKTRIRIQNKAPRIDYKIIDGIIHPLNYDSLAMVSVYHQFEKIYDFLIDNIDISIDNIGKSNIYFDYIEITDNYLNILKNKKNILYTWVKCFFILQNFKQ